MDFLLALLMYLGLIPYPSALENPAMPTLVEPTGSDGTTTEDPVPEDSTRPRTCGRNCTF